MSISFRSAARAEARGHLTFRSVLTLLGSSVRPSAVALLLLGIVAPVAAASLAGGLTHPVHTGWKNPATGGNGDYVFIDTPKAGATAQGLVTVKGRAGTSSTDPNGGGGTGGGDFATKPQVVIAMIDTGGNPYNVDFRDPTRLVHPSTYLSGFPANAKAVPLCFIDGTGTGPFAYNDDCSSSFFTNVAADLPRFSGVTTNDLVWYPGTRLMSKSFAHDDTKTPIGIDEGPDDDPLTEDSLTSHGSWVSSTAIGNKFGDCPECLLVILEGDTVEAIDAAYLWAAQQPWIDVITSSTSVGLAVGGFNPGIFAENHDAGVVASTNGKIFLNAAGNGAANAGLVPTSTYLYGSSSPTVIPVGASDEDGLASHWSDFPAEIMANGESRQVAETATMSGETAVGGTSFSSPGAAGVLARSLLKAREACHDYAEGASAAAGGTLTLLRNNGCTVTAGPFANGILTRDELHEAFVKNAVPAYDQLSLIPGPIGWVKNAYGWVDLGHGVNNGGSSIQPAVTGSILGTNPIPVRSLEQFWYDSIVREGQSQMWGPRPVVDGDADAFPRDDAACMPTCAPTELQRYVAGFSGMSSSASYQDLFNVLGVSAEQFAAQQPRGIGGALTRPRHDAAGIIGEAGDITVSNDATTLTVRLALAGQLDGFVPTVRSNPVSYEVALSTNHNGLVQQYRLTYEFQAIDFLALTEGKVSEPLADRFGMAIETAPTEQGNSWICEVNANLSASYVDLDTNEAVWVLPLSAFKQDNRPVQATADCAAFTTGGRALRSGDTITGLAGSAVLTVGIVNFGSPPVVFTQTTADDYTLTGGDTDGDGVPDSSDACPMTPVGADIDARGCPFSVALSVNGASAGTAMLFDGEWTAQVDFAGREPVDGIYTLKADFGTATESVALVAANSALSVTLTGQCGDAACSDATTYETSPDAPLTVMFTATAAHGSGQNRRYTFDFGDGTTAGPMDASTVEHQYPAANPAGYRVTVAVTEDNATVLATDEMLVRTATTVTVDPDPVATAASLVLTPTSGDASLTVTADASATQHATGTATSVYSFDFGDGAVSSGDPATATHIYTVAGSYTVTVTVTDRDANDAVLGTPSSASGMVAVGSGHQLTALLAVSPTRLRVNETVTFDGCHSFAADGQSITSFTFDPDGAEGDLEPVTQTVTDPVTCDDGHNDASVYRYAYTKAGTYTPSLTIRDSEGVARFALASVAVVTPPPKAETAGGGGALGLAFLLPLAGGAALRRRRRSPQA